MKFKKIILDSGLRVVLSEMPAMESISIGVWISAGGRYEKKEQAGISHFLEHMVFKGTKKRSAQDLKEAIEGRGGSLNGFTGEEFTCYLAKVLSKNADIALDVLLDMTINPRISREDFLKERLVILEEIKMYIDMPNHHVQELLVELLWPGQPLGMPLAGTQETVTALTHKDLAYYQENYYTQKDIVISIAGKLPSFDLLGIIEKIFRGRKEKPQQSFQPVVLDQAAPRTNFYNKPTEQTHIAFGLHGFNRFSVNKYHLDLLHIILGGNMSSRLFQKVREEEGLAYEISSSVKHYHDTGALIIGAGIDNSKVNKAMKLILKELARIKKTRVTKAELERAKEFYRGQLLMIYEDTMSQMLWLGEKNICGDPEFRAEQILKRVNAVTVDDILAAGKKVLKSGNCNLAVIGPTKKSDIKDIEAGLKDL